MTNDIKDAIRMDQQAMREIVEIWLSDEQNEAKLIFRTVAIGFDMAMRQKQKPKVAADQDGLFEAWYKRQTVARDGDGVIWREVCGSLVGVRAARQIWDDAVKAQEGAV